MTDAGFFVGLGLLALFLVGTIAYMLMSGHRPGMRDLDGGSGSGGMRAQDATRQAELYEKPHHEQHKHHDNG
jgi:hypothetical protein